MTASENGRLRLFVQIPVYDRTQKFTLYRVHHLPVRTSDVTAVTWSALPDYLAVAIDAQSFVELSRHEVDQCHGGNAEVCHFHGGMAKRNRPLTCAMTLFLDDAQPETIKQRCRPQKIPWNGSQTVYLGNQQWALSDKVSTEITMACHTVKGRPTHHILRLPVSGVFKLQLGCTGHTAEWLFPASNIGTATFSDNNVDWTPRQNALPQWKEGPRRREEAPDTPQRQAKEETDTNADALIKQQTAIMEEIDEWLSTPTSTTSFWQRFGTMTAGSVGPIMIFVLSLYFYRRLRQLELRLQQHEEAGLETVNTEPPSSPEGAMAEVH